MKTISSFMVDHNRLPVGVYISRIDGDIITYDLRTCKPNTYKLMDNSTMHSVEHLFATMVRNSEIADNVIYFGPMGCQTGFYLLVRDAVSPETVLAVIKNTLKTITEYSGEMPGNSAKECGNYLSLSVPAANSACLEYYEEIRNLKKVLNYSEL